MKNRINIIIELIVLFALSIGITLVVDNSLEKEGTEILGIIPINTEEDGTVIWNFAENKDNLLEENLLKPVRKKYGMVATEDAFSRCSSNVFVQLSDRNGDIYVDGFYYGTLIVALGCDDIKEYPLKVDSMGYSFEIQDESGEYIPVKSWLKMD